jgi:hypothetical protein
VALCSSLAAMPAGIKDQNQWVRHQQRKSGVLMLDADLYGKEMGSMIDCGGTQSEDAQQYCSCGRNSVDTAVLKVGQICASNSLLGE